jgi:hypothetical protein
MPWLSKVCHAEFQSVSTVNKIFQATGYAASLLALLALLGGHWLALQTVAWSVMVVQYSRQAPLVEAVIRTFDGRHPCQLCLSIKDGRQKEHAQSQGIPWPKPDKETELLCEAKPCLLKLPALARAPLAPFTPRPPAHHIDSPPTPPPRAA